jgi:hypothetical protein
VAGGDRQGRGSAHRGDGGLRPGTLSGGTEGSEDLKHGGMSRAMLPGQGESRQESRRVSAPATAHSQGAVGAEELSHHAAHKRDVLTGE